MATSASEFGFSAPDLLDNAGNMWETEVANGITQSRIGDANNYNTQMADTVYQRGVADMKAAGLNPILAAGSPDPMASSAMSAGLAAPVSSPQSFGGVSTGSAMNSLQEQKMKADTAGSLASAAKTLADERISIADLPKHVADSGPYRQNSKLAGMIDFIDQGGLAESAARGAMWGAGTAPSLNDGGLKPQSTANSALDPLSKLIDAGADMLGNLYLGDN